MKEDAMPKRPGTVTMAVYLLYLSIGIWLIELLSVRLKADVTGSVILEAEMASLLMMTLVCYLTGRGRNWARIVLLIAAILGTPQWLVVIIFQPKPAHIAIIQLSIQLVAVLLLFQQPSSHWFKTMRELSSKDKSHAAI
jgi:hypothetical protein